MRLLHRPITLRIFGHPIQRLECRASLGHALVEEKAWYDNPDEVHEDEVEPEIVCFRTTVAEVFVVVVEQACGVVEDVSVNLPDRDDCLDRIAEWVLSKDQIDGDEGQRTPEECSNCFHAENEWLHFVRRRSSLAMVELTSDVMYLLSLNAYSFHSWPNKSIAGAMRVWFNEKYPSKKRWIDPAEQLVSRHMRKGVQGMRTQDKP
jgi:hypothetical protein